MLTPAALHLDWGDPPSRDAERMSFSDLLGQLSYAFGGNQYSLPVMTTQPGKKQDPIPAEFLGFVQAFADNAVVHSVVMARARLFTEARFIWKNNLTGKLFGNESLRLLEEPWPNGTTGDLLMLAELSASCAGNAYLWRHEDQLEYLRPDWVSIILASELDPSHPAFAADARIVGYVYAPPGAREQIIPVTEMAHWTPIPDPRAPWRGMSWLTPIIREVMSDNATTDHKLSFFEHGATPNLAIKLPPTVIDPKQFAAIRDEMEKSHAGSANAWKTLYLAAGADVEQVGMDMRNMDFRAIQGAGEVRIAMAAGVPAAIAGVNESLQGASLNDGNFKAARRLFADMYARPQWRSFCASVAKLVTKPQGATLWYDDRAIAFLKEDQKDLAEIQQAQAATVTTLINGGYDYDAAVAFVMSNDLASLMGKHTGLVSVQLQSPGAMTDKAAEKPAEPPPDPAGPDSEQE